jgi:hypothetical protein
VEDELCAAVASDRCPAPSSHSQRGWGVEPVVSDHGLITRRKPEGLGSFCAGLVAEVREVRLAR